MKLSLERVQQVARQTGFNVVTVEKVIHLMNLLEAIDGHPVLRGKFALKGGTALNLFVFPLPRLSVDIDLNLVEPLSREKLEAIRPRFEQAFEAVFRREEFNIRKSPTEHAGGKWRLGYRSVAGAASNLEVDVNYVLRIPLWEPEVRDSATLGEYAAKNVRVLSEAELAGGKLSALFSRAQTRDLFDAHQLLTKRNLNHERLHIAFVVYGGFNRLDRQDDLGDEGESRRTPPTERHRPEFPGCPIGSGRDTVGTPYGRCGVAGQDSFTSDAELEGAQRSYVSRIVENTHTLGNNPAHA
ncbi:MAG: nucleotidyl transferase AbiEii/AbiGii toxin family protein [Alkalispirochaeta sp.]